MTDNPVQAIAPEWQLEKTIFMCQPLDLSLDNAIIGFQRADNHRRIIQVHKRASLVMKL
jgi:hypothetical protein